MNMLVLMARGYVVFLALIFTFGQLFFGAIKWPATVAGVFGLLSAAMSGRFMEASSTRGFVVAGWCAASLIGVAWDAADYYRYYDIPGNSYAWELIAPFCLCLVFIAWRAVRRPASRAGGAHEK